MSTEDLVLQSEPRSGVRVLTLNDPSKRNAMGEEMAEVFRRRIVDLKSESSVRVLVVRGAEGAFSAGGDLEMLRAKSEKDLEENSSGMMKFYNDFLSVTELEIPVIAALNGHAVGAGLCFALACDIRVASEKAKLGLNFVRLGLHPGMGVTYSLPRLVGPAKAAELLFSGRIITANEALDLGIVNSVVGVDDFDKAVEKLVDEILAGGPTAIKALKLTLRDYSAKSLKHVLEREASCQAKDYSGAEFLEGIAAAKEKRSPNF